MPVKSSVAGAVALSLIGVFAGAPAMAADLSGAEARGSIKDGYTAPMAHGPAGPCYGRFDAGYAVSQDPTITWPVNSIDNTTTPATTTFITDAVTNVTLENTWLVEGGLGCQLSAGSRGFRVEAILGYHGERAMQGEPGNFTVTGTGSGLPAGTYGAAVDPLHTKLTSYTAMLNGYKDLGNYFGLVPYIGAGVGLSYNELSDVSFTGNPFLLNQIHGGNTLAFAWAAMAGVGYQISDRAILDVGYRYLDLGHAASERVDNLGFVNPRVNVGDIAAHEFKVGLRYHFDTSANQLAYGAMK